MVDTPVSGTGDCKIVGVQVPSSAWYNILNALLAQQDRASVS